SDVCSSDLSNTTRVQRRSRDWQCYRERSLVQESVALLPTNNLQWLASQSLLHFATIVADGDTSVNDCVTQSRRPRKNQALNIFGIRTATTRCYDSSHKNQPVPIKVTGHLQIALYQEDT